MQSNKYVNWSKVYCFFPRLLNEMFWDSSGLINFLSIPLTLASTSFPPTKPKYEPCNNTKFKYLLD